MLRVIGPPGTGKTKFLADQVTKWVTVDGIPPDQIVGCSFTRAAAAVLRGRITELPSHNFATLHALAYRGLGSPPIAEVGELRKLWNEQTILPEEWKLGADKADVEEGLLEEGDYGSMLAGYSLYRAGRSQDVFLWERVRYFAERWEDFKAQTSSIDFQDMIDLALLELPTCPGDPVAFVVDEAQDLTPTQLALAQQWGAGATHYLVAGDPAQVLYGFAGARPDELLAPLPAEQQRLLRHSYRLPPLLQQYAETWLERHSPPMIYGRTYQARAGRDGELRRSWDTWREPLDLAPLLEHLLSGGRDAMVLATCSYMLAPSIAELRAAGIPFHNPYRTRSKAWNPLGRARAGEVSTMQRVQAFLRPVWSGESEAAWLKMLPAEWFAGTRKAALEELTTEQVSADRIVGLLKEQAAPAVLARDIYWLAQAVAPAYKRGVELAVNIVLRSGLSGLTEEPRVVIGTIHSVKGAEADAVVLFPDLSPRAAEEAATREGRDAVIRQAYVGYTRARQTLVRAAAEREERSFRGV